MESSGTEKNIKQVNKAVNSRTIIILDRLYYRDLRGIILIKQVLLLFYVFFKLQHFLIMSSGDAGLISYFANRLF